MNMVLLLYIVAATIYTTYTFVLEPLLDTLSKSLRVEDPLGSSRMRTSAKEMVAVGHRAAQTARTVDSGNSHASSAMIPESLFLSKAFAGAMQPSKVVPYYYKASEQPEKEDITIVTKTTSNRLQAFERLVRAYSGTPCHKYCLNYTHFSLILIQVQCPSPSTSVAQPTPESVSSINSIHYISPTQRCLDG